MTDILTDIETAAARKWAGDPDAQQAGLFARAAGEIRSLRAARPTDDWIAEAMALAHECTLCYSDMEHDSENDHLRDWVLAKMKLVEHLRNRP